MRLQVRHVATDVGFIRDTPRGRRSIAKAMRIQSLISTDFNSV